MQIAIIVIDYILGVLRIKIESNTSPAEIILAGLFFCLIIIPVKTTSLYLLI